MDLLVFSHLRWDFVYQRPQHLMSRFAKQQRAFFWEEPKLDSRAAAFLEVSKREDLLTVATPHLPSGSSEQEVCELQRELLLEFLEENEIHHYGSWYYTPMARGFSRDLHPTVIVYDCMDELSGFRGAPPGLTTAEDELFHVADLVFTGGQSLYRSKKSRHPVVHLFPSSIDFRHFAQARKSRTEPPDQSSIPHPRLGYCGVIDERMDLDLLFNAATLRPDWQFVMLGPVVKISEAELPGFPNFHYLGAKPYGDLPAYLSGWDVALLPFARNESTRFISPTKTPEYLAAGLPVVSTPITDVVSPYGEAGLVSIVETSAQLVEAADRELRRTSSEHADRQVRADVFLSGSSWDKTFQAMNQLISEEVSKASPVPALGTAKKSSSQNLGAD